MDIVAEIDSDEILILPLGRSAVIVSVVEMDAESGDGVERDLSRDEAVRLSETSARIFAKVPVELRVIVVLR